jgi:hypothetical protein
MINPVPDPKEACTESASPLFDSAVQIEIPPERRKIDPSTIRWPEGIPKPWEQDGPAEDRGV